MKPLPELDESYAELLAADAAFIEALKEVNFLLDCLTEAKQRFKAEQRRALAIGLETPVYEDIFTRSQRTSTGYEERKLINRSRENGLL